MPRKLSAAIDARIVELAKRKGTTERQIALVLKREGHDVTASGVHRALSRLGLAGEGKRAKATAKARHKPSSREESTTVPPPPSEPADLDGDDSTARLRRTIANLEAASKQAETDKDVGRMVQCGRAIAEVTKLLEKLSPPPAPSVDERPDMIAAAKRAREHAHAFFDRLLEAAS